MHVRVHAGQLFCYRMLRTVFLLCQALYPPGFGEELADLLGDVPTILLGHGITSGNCLRIQKAFRMREELECRGKKFGVVRRDQRNWVYWRESSILQRIPDVGGGSSLCLSQSAGVLIIRIRSLN